MAERLAERLGAYPTGNLCNAHAAVQAMDARIMPLFAGARLAGPARTARISAGQNAAIHHAVHLAAPGEVLVVDGGGSLRCALIGDQLAQLAIDSGWEGALINGCVRDTETLSILPIGIKALNTNPRRSVKRGQGERDIAVQFARVTFNPRHYLYADPDGIVVAASSLEPAPTMLV